MNKCGECHYYGKTRFGAVCNYDGTYNPVMEECPNFKPRSQAEEEVRKDIEFTKLLISIIDKLVQLSPQIEKLKDEELKNELLEVCVAAKQIKNLLK